MQVKIKESINNTLVLGSSLIRFHERIKIDDPCLIYALPKFYADKFLSGEYVIRRESFKKDANGKIIIWNDQLVHKETQRVLQIEDVRKPFLGKISSISGEGVGIERKRGELLQTSFEVEDKQENNGEIESDLAIKTLSVKPLRYRSSNTQETEPTALSGLIYLQTNLQWESSLSQLKWIGIIRQSSERESSEIISCSFLGDLPSI